MLAVSIVFALAGGEGGAVLPEDGATVLTGGDVEVLSDTVWFESNILVCAVFTGAVTVVAVAGGVCLGEGGAGEVCLGEGGAGEVCLGEGVATGACLGEAVA